jgi:hypothetical protein
MLIKNFKKLLKEISFFAQSKASINVILAALILGISGFIAGCIITGVCGFNDSSATIAFGQNQNQNCPAQGQRCTLGCDENFYVCYLGFCYRCDRHPQRTAAGLLDLSSGNCTVVSEQECIRNTGIRCKAGGKE